ncbi:arylsulfatase [Prosthecobacter sp.]|uniref:arylsulfatase n=1 Tax=Prosthecobacter sp. TaxID=1965333 RepID=UPI001DF798B0|nr:arylsulfatase [Prosthecobacter sp.]MCB1276923.1 arylsulfatase [Prosthecobacter sp.]
MIRLPLFVLLLAVTSLHAASSKPNFLLILADDLGYSDLGCYGSEIATPNLDKLAAEGLRFTQFYNTARCWPTRSVLMTGHYAQQVGMDPQYGRFPDWVRTLPQRLSKLGYRSYHSGKWHVNNAPKVVADGGFTRSYYVAQQDNHFHPKRHELDDKPLPEPDGPWYSSTAMAQYAIDFLKEHAQQHADTPFFTYLAFTAPHFPVQAPQEDIDKYKDHYTKGWPATRAARFAKQKEVGLVHTTLSDPEPQITAPSGKESDLEILGPGETRHAVPWESLTEEQKQFQATKEAIHAAMIDRLDQEVGRVLAQLKAMNAMENTLILFLSDNGASAEVMVRGLGHDKTVPMGSGLSYLCLGPGGSTVSNTPFRRHKIWTHEGGISTPLIAHWPQGIAVKGELRDTPGHVIDIVPTLLALAGDEHPVMPDNAPPYPGRSLVPAFAKDETISRDYLFWNHSGNHALREGDWKIVSAADNNDVWELYDLSTDRAESNNLAAKDPERVKAMAERWVKLEKEFVAQAGPKPAVKAKGSGKGKKAEK